MGQACQPTQQDAPSHPEKHNWINHRGYFFFIFGVTIKVRTLDMKLSIKNVHNVLDENTLNGNNQ